jgi:hypothetical protein
VNVSGLAVGTMFNVGIEFVSMGGSDVEVYRLTIVPEPNGIVLLLTSLVACSFFQRIPGRTLERLFENSEGATSFR